MVKSTENRKFELNRSQQLSHTRFGVAPNRDTPTELLDDHRALEPPDPIPNSAVKRCIADGSVGFPHVRVGHRQALNKETSPSGGVFLFLPCPLLLSLPPPCDRFAGSESGQPQAARRARAWMARVNVGHRQALYRNAPIWKQVGAFLFARGKCRLRGTKAFPYLSAQRACAPCRTTALASLHCRS